MINKIEEAQVRDVERRMIDTYPQLPAAQVVATIAQARDRFADSPVREFVTVFVERQARRELSQCVEGFLARAGQASAASSVQIRDPIRLNAGACA